MRNKIIEELSEIAKRRGGILISTDYKNNTSKLKCQCFHNHVFETTAQEIRRGSWCPRCKAYNRTETICRLYFEHIFQTIFPKKRPEWLTTDTKTRLELDGYSEACMIAFEYNGPQHYRKTSWFRDADPEIAKIREAIKIEKCKERNVYLVIIDYKVKVSDLLQYIKTCLDNLKYPNLEFFNWTEPSLKEIYTNEVYIDKLRKDLSDEGFTLLDSEYRGETYKYAAKCNICGRVRKATAGVLRKYLCKRCSGMEKKTIGDAKKLAKSRGGKCLSTVYINNSSPLQWQCSCGYVWDASYNCVQRGFWCPKDGAEQKKISIKDSWVERRKAENLIKFEEVKVLAEKYNLKLLSTEYIDCDNPLIFLCPNGHKWDLGFRAFRKAIKEDRGCTFCGPNALKNTKAFRNKS